MNVCGLQLGRPWGHGQAEQRLCRPVQNCGARPSRTEIVRVWISSMTGLGGMAQNSGDGAGQCRPGGGAGRAELEHVWIPGLSGLRGTGLRSRYCAGLFRPGGHGPVEQRSCVCVLLHGRSSGFLFTYSYVHTLFGPFLPPAHCTLPISPNPLASGQTCSALFSNFVEEKTYAII
jgi:hypothetical protein